ncbi:hypothetical protein DFH11DRAFT_1324550 [Phellopilus nigrolimitatus]|nr:hypothetical protein DFH11DRAFT_1324550 [Phellopilus nigrolimitatus]
MDGDRYWGAETPAFLARSIAVHDGQLRLLSVVPLQPEEELTSKIRAEKHSNIFLPDDGSSLCHIRSELPILHTYLETPTFRTPTCLSDSPLTFQRCCSWGSSVYSPVQRRRTRSRPPRSQVGWKDDGVAVNLPFHGCFIRRSAQSLDFCLSLSHSIWYWSEIDGSNSCLQCGVFERSHYQACGRQCMIFKFSRDAIAQQAMRVSELASKAESSCVGRVDGDSTHVLCRRADAVFETSLSPWKCIGCA